MAPLWEVPSIVTGEVITGSGLPDAGLIVHTPEAWLGSEVGMEKLIVSNPVTAFASWMAARSVHSAGPPLTVDPVLHTPLPGLLSPVSAVELTVNVRLVPTPGPNQSVNQNRATKVAVTATAPVRRARRLGQVRGGRPGRRSRAGQGMGALTRKAPRRIRGCSWSARPGT